MPTPYNGAQSPLEFYAINGNTLYPNTGRISIIQQTKIGTTKYNFNGPYRNPAITGNPNDAYGVTNSKALADSVTPFNGRGTGDGISNGVYAAINNYTGGNTEDINGAASMPGSGRDPQVTLNAGLWGYGPTPIAGTDYTKPNTSANRGQVII